MILSDCRLCAMYSLAQRRDRGLAKLGHFVEDSEPRKHFWCWSDTAIEHDCLGGFVACHGCKRKGDRLEMEIQRDGFLKFMLRKFRGFMMEG